LVDEGMKVGLVPRKAEIGNEDLFGLVEMAMYGIKGLSAYLFHAETLRNRYPECYT